MLLCGIAVRLAAQAVSINTDNSAPDSSAILDVKSTEKGMLIPRMDETQRMAIASPAMGLLVYDETSQSFWFYNDTAWEEIHSGYLSVLKDADGDTRIQVEESPDEDKVRIDLAGTERFILSDNANGRTRIDIQNTSADTYLGALAGLSDPDQSTIVTAGMSYLPSFLPSGNVPY